MRIWLFEAPKALINRATRSQFAFHISGTATTGLNTVPGYDYSTAVLRLRQFLGDVPLTGTSKLVQVNS